MIRQIREFLNTWRYGSPVIVVSGLPRSGTSMMMKMLKAGGVSLLTDEIRKADSDNPKGYFELERVKTLDKAADKSWLAEARGKALKVISQLVTELPPANRYKLIFLNRDLDEVLASQAKMLERRGEPVDRSEDGRMREMFHSHLRRVKAWLAKQPNFEVLEMDYAATIEGPLEASRQVQDFLQTDIDPLKMAAVVDPNLYRNRSPRSSCFGDR